MASITFDTRVLIALTVAVAVAAAIGGWSVGRRVGWAPAGPLVVLAATPLVPHLPIWLGISTDDVLPGMAVVLGLRAVPWRSWRAVRPPPLLTVGAGAAALAGVIASAANATDALDLLQMVMRSTGHIAFLGLITMTVALAGPPDRRRHTVATALAAVATFEAAFGLVAWFVPLPGGLGLEPARKLTSLYGVVPGRISGTTGLSPDFLGAIFVLTVPITVALALNASARPHRALWWGAAAVQVVALALTFTRTSLVIGLVALVVMLLSRRHLGPLLAIGALVAVIAFVTPLGARLIGDANDRLALWTSSARMLEDRPLTGVGPGKTIATAAANPDRYIITRFGVATSSAHNVVLLAGAETGMVGAVGIALLVLAMALAAVRALATSWRLDGPRAPPDLTTRAAALGVLGFLVQGMTNNLVAVQVTSVVAALVFASYLLPVDSARSVVDVEHAPNPARA
jgi:hypothetical protein